MVHLLNMSDENCRNHKTLAEEDMLGHITRLASACHGATVSLGFFRGLAFLGPPLGQSHPKTG